MKHQAVVAESYGKFENPKVTANGEIRAHVSLTKAETLWFNTGTLCNITCQRCYIESSPTNDRLVYMSEAEVVDFLGQIKERNWPVREIGFTGGEPFMNPEIIAMAHASLRAGYSVLILTNAMRPMMRERMQSGLLDLLAQFGNRITLRVSIDHYSARFHDEERGAGTFARTLVGMNWLNENGFRTTVAGRTVWGETEAEARSGFAELYLKHGLLIDANNPAETVLFPEMDETVDVPEITTDCWRILNQEPDQIMCASSRMVVKRNGSDKPAVLACTLLPYSSEFELGSTLAEAECDVMLNHPHCAKFCVLGGARCSD